MMRILSQNHLARCACGYMICSLAEKQGWRGLLASVSAAIAAVLTEDLLHSALFPLMEVPCKKGTSSVVRLEEGLKFVQAAISQGL